MVYLTYQVNELAVFAKRLRMPLFMYSASLDVGIRTIGSPRLSLFTLSLLIALMALKLRTPVTTSILTTAYKRHSAARTPPSKVMTNNLIFKTTTRLRWWAISAKTT